MKRITATVILTVSTLLCADVFLQGNKQFNFGIGAGRGYGSDYTIVGIGGSYFFLNGLSVGLTYRGWFGGDPSLNEISVPVTYYIPLHQKFRPYVGAFYRRSFVGSGFDDYNSYGARAGVAYSFNSNSYVSAGWVQEYFDSSQDGDNSNGYPEIAIGFSF
jgi:hypothetical protein